MDKQSKRGALLSIIATFAMVLAAVGLADVSDTPEPGSPATPDHPAVHLAER